MARRSHPQAVASFLGTFQLKEAFRSREKDQGPDAVGLKSLPSGGGEIPAD
jgi:hypothetical protein